MLRFFRIYLIPIVKSPFFRVFIILFAIIQIVARIASWSEKAYKEDMKWERPPDRLPDIVDATIEMQNRDAKIQQLTREFDKAISMTSTVNVPIQNRETEQNSGK